MFNLNSCSEADDDLEADHEGGSLMSMDDRKEPLFEKPLTPSDVGKLNRLVIPKQHAERYFPLGGGGGGEAGEKGFLLSFEDEMGKHWKFRYSYWNSSQSYVLTKGWSRFVKEKQLDAGDYVMFSRDRGDGDRLFIGWRRRHAVQGSGCVTQAAGGGSGGNQGGMDYTGSQQPCSSPQTHQYLHAGASGNSRRGVRLFGVNLECEADVSEPSTSTDGSGQEQPNPNLYHQHKYYCDKFHNYKGWP